MIQQSVSNIMITKINNIQQKINNILVRNIANAVMWRNGLCGVTVFFGT